MDTALEDALNVQANHECFAAHSYEALAWWCAARDYAGFADFFRKQAAEEREHAQRFLEHLTDRGGEPTLTAVASPKQGFGTLQEVATHAESLEKQNSANIHACYRLATEKNELASLPFLLEFIDEQVEEEAWTASMLVLTRRAECAGAVLNLDRHIGKLLGAHEGD